MTTEQKIYFQHKHGGIYRYINTIKNKSYNGEIMILYQHVYPFDEEMYVRKKDEFDELNKQLSNEQLDELLAKPRDKFRKEIIEKKNKEKEQNQYYYSKTGCICELGYIV